METQSTGISTTTGIKTSQDSNDIRNHTIEKRFAGCVVVAHSEQSPKETDPPSEEELSPLAQSYKENRFNPFDCELVMDDDHFEEIDARESHMNPKSGVLII